jgi:hypothetical protein
MDNLPKHKEFIDFYHSLPSWLYYSTNKEYRDTIRKVFRFHDEKKSTYADMKLSDVYETDLDAETLDEVSFDTEQMEIGMQTLYEITEKQTLFQELYALAAGRMFSTDPKIGQAVLCSFDYFSEYHTVVWYYLLDGYSAAIKCPSYENLCNNLK